MAIVVVMQCATCGREYTPTREAIIAGTWRKACPVCTAARKDAT